MRTSEKAFATLAVILTALTMAACGQQGSNKDVAGGFAKPGETAQILGECAAQRLSTMATVFGETIKVCRRDADGKIQVTEINPNYYAGSGVVGSSKSGVVRRNVRLVQVISTHINSSIPEAKPKEIENAVNQFLTQTCAPMMRQVMKRSNVTARFVFQTARQDDELAKPNTAFANTAAAFGDSTTVLDQGSAPANSTLDDEKDQPRTGDLAGRELGTGVKETKKEAAKVSALPTARETRRNRQYELSSQINHPNLILELVYGADRGITIKDHVKPVSSGPLELKGAGAVAEPTASEQNFCAQLMTYVGENLGLGGLAPDQKCADDSQVSLAKTDANAVSKPTGPANIGLMKSAKAETVDFKKLKLENQEVLDILKPVCSEIETAVKLRQKTKK